MRAMFNRDVATGFYPVSDDYSSGGPEDTWFVKNFPPKMPKAKCYILYPESCTASQYELVKNGSGVVKDYFLQESEENQLLDVSSMSSKQKTLNEEL
jgi:hypothetical protein